MRERTLDCKHAHDETCGYVPADPGQPCGYECKFCPIEALIDALPQHVTGDNRDTVTEQLQKILSLYTVLDETEQEQVDITPCIRLQEELDGANRIQTLEGEIPVTAEMTTWNSGTYIVNQTVEITERVSVKGDVTLVLNTDCKLTASKGISVTTNNSLTITGEGELVANASSTDGCAGIGGSTGGGADVTIAGGAVSATGGSGTLSSNADFSYGGGAGVGGGGGTDTTPASAGVAVTIRGGTVTAGGGGSFSSETTTPAGEGGAGIGLGGLSAEDRSFTFNADGSAWITATGGAGAAIAQHITNGVPENASGVIF